MKIILILDVLAEGNAGWSNVTLTKECPKRGKSGTQTLDSSSSCMDAGRKVASGVSDLPQCVQEEIFGVSK